MVEETKEELVKEEKKKEDGVKKENFDLYAPIYSINHRTPSGDAVGLLKVSSETKKYILEGLILIGMLLKRFLILHQLQK